MEKFNLTPIERILLGKEHNISTWVLSGYDDLVQHSDEGPYTEAIAEAIGYRVSLKLCKCQAKKLWEGNPNYLRDEFKADFDAIQEQESRHTPEEGADAIPDAPFDQEGNAAALRELQKKLRQAEAKFEESKQYEEQLTRDLANLRGQLETTTEDLDKTRLHAEAAKEKAAASHQVAISNLEADLRHIQAALAMQRNEVADEKRRMEGLQRDLKTTLEKERAEHRIMQERCRELEANETKRKTEEAKAKAKKAERK